MSLPSDQAYAIYETSLGGIDFPVPPHIAIIMDGNGRWASKRFLPRIAGHKQGVDALKGIVSACVRRGVQVLTVFAFSSENHANTSWKSNY